MLVLFETPAGYALFKVTDEKKLADGDVLQKEFETPEGAAKMIKLKAFAKFQDTVEVRRATCKVSKAAQSLQVSVSLACIFAGTSLAAGLSLEKHNR